MIGIGLWAMWKFWQLSYHKWVFKNAMIINMWWIKNSTNNHFQMEVDKKCDVGPFLKLSFKKI